MTAAMDVLSSDALLGVIADSDFVTAHGVVRLSATCKEIRRACRRHLATRYGCGNDVLMLWLVLVGQRLSWIKDAMYPLWRTAWLLWKCSDKRYRVSEISSPLFANTRGDAGYLIKDWLAGVACVEYGGRRGRCTVAPENDIEDLVYASYKSYRKRPTGFVATCSSPPFSNYDKHPTDYAMCLEEGLPSQIPYCMEDDSHLRTLTRLVSNEGKSELARLRPVANPAQIHPAMRHGLQRVIFAYDGLTAMLEALSWETDVSSRIEKDFSRERIASARSTTRRVVHNLQAILSGGGFIS